MGDKVTMFEAFANMFETIKTDAGTDRVCLRDHAHGTALSEMVRQAANDMDDDSAYEFVRNILRLAAETGIEYIEDLGDTDLPEPDFETFALINWLGRNLRNVALCSEYYERVEGQFYDLDTYIADGQRLAYEYARQAIIDNWPECECGESYTVYEDWLDEQCRGCYSGGHNGIATRSRK